MYLSCNFMKKYFIKLISHSLSTLLSLWENFNHSRCDDHHVMWNMHMFGAVHALVWHFKRKTLGADDITYLGHYEKSLCCDNDLRWCWRKIKTISLDWIVLSRRLLIFINDILQPNCYCQKWQNITANYAPDSKFDGCRHIKNPYIWLLKGALDKDNLV